jgi:hypothetical protein
MGWPSYGWITPTKVEASGSVWLRRRTISAGFQASSAPVAPPAATQLSAV